MPKRIPAQSWPQCRYRIHYVESKESILRLQGWHRHRHRFWAIDVGMFSASCKVGGKVFKRDRNSVAVYAPGTWYEENSEVGRLGTHSWLLLDEDGEPSLLRRLTGKSGFALLHDPTRKISRGITEFFEIANTNSPGKQFFLAACLNHILGTLFALHARGSEEKEERSLPKKNWVHPWRSTVMKMLDRSSPKLVTAREVAEELGVSLSTFTHEYRKVGGESFRETVRSWRLEKISALLAVEDLSLKQVAAKSGFSHQSYLSVFLHATTGYTPSEYRKLIRAGLAPGKKPDRREPSMKLTRA